MASNRRRQDSKSSKHQEDLLETNTNNNSQRCCKIKQKCTCPVCVSKEKAVPVAVIYKKQSDSCQCDECQCAPVCECEECCPKEEEEEICTCTTCKLDRKKSKGRKGR